jgi:hypothetical protein
MISRTLRFHDVIRASSFAAHRVLRRVATLSHSPAPPVLPAIPETEYVKRCAFAIAR